MDESNPSKAAPWLDAAAESLTGAPTAEENTELSTRPLARAAAAVPPATATLSEGKPLEPGSKDAPQPNHYTVKLEAFEGPLDLLLYLIRREEINIWDIPIAHITAQYLEYVQLMKDLNLNLAGEFLVMAATLIHIKSRLLLPPDPRQAAESAEAQDPRRELVYQLLEHEKFKNAAQMLYAKEAVESEVWSKPPREFMEEGEEMIAATLFDLVSAYRDIVQRLAERITLDYRREELTVEEKMAEIRNRLLVHTRLLFSALFEWRLDRRTIVVTFLAVLELTRLGEIRLLQDKAMAEIFLHKFSENSTALVMGAMAT